MKVLRPRFTPARMVTALAIASAIAGIAPLAVAQSDSLMLEEVIVTARKREESLMKVAQSVSAMSQSQLEAAFARDVRDLEGMAPNLVIDRIGAGPGVASISIRGVTHQDVEKSFDPAVGVVLDGIFLGTNTGQEFQVYDMERVEVLRGPQGTLFGKNSIGGIINVTRTTPTGAWGGKIRGTYGDYDRADIEAVLNFPIMDDKLAGKVSYISRTQGEGFYDNFYRHTEEPEIDYEAYGINLLWTPREDLGFEYTYDYQEDNSDTAATGNFSQPTDLLCAALGRCAQGPTTAQLGGAYKTDQNFSNEQYIELDAHTFAANWFLNDDYTLTYLFGYRESEEATNQDFDSTSADFFSTFRAQDYEQTSHELRLAGKLNEQLSFVVGGYSWDSAYDLYQELHYFLTIAVGLPPGAIATPRTEHETESWAVFFEADYAFNDQWILTLGGRYTDEEKEMGRGSEIDLFGDGSVILPDFSTFDNPGQGDWDEDTYKASISYQMNDDQLFYLTYAEGFRSGGLNGRAGAPSSALAVYDPEFVDMLELGWKATLLDNRLQVSVAIFAQEYDDKQEEVVVAAPDSAQGQETIALNAAEASMSGIELDVKAVIVEGWTLGMNYGYLDAEYDDFLFDGVDLSNLELRRAPEYTYAINSHYQFQVGAGTASIQATYRYKDDMETTFQNVSYGHVNGHGLLDASISYDWDNWTVRVFGRNLTDAEEVSGALSVAGLFGFAGWRDPRIWGAQVAYRWGE